MVLDHKPDGTVSERVFPLPRSFANVKRGFSEWRWQDAKGWARKKLAHASNRKYRPSEKQKLDPTVTKAKNNDESPPNSGGSPAMQAPLATRRPTSGQRWQHGTNAAQSNCLTSSAARSWPT